MCIFNERVILKKQRNFEMIIPLELDLRNRAFFKTRKVLIVKCRLIVSGSGPCLLLLNCMY